MKKILLLVCLTTLFDCVSQSKKINKENNNKKMEYFNIDIYNDWEIDTNYSPSERRKFLKKNNELLCISLYENTIQVERSSVLHPYTKTYVYNKKTSLLLVFVMEFYQFSIEVVKTYDETGILIKEKDYDKPYIFSLSQLIEKIKKEQNVDLEDKTQRASVRRSVDSILKKPIYEIYLPSKEDPISKRDYFLIDGITGEVIHTATYFRRRDEAINPFNKYILSLKNKEIEDNSYYKSYKGKDYTKREWEAFEEEWYRDFEEKKEGRNFFWDNIFKKLNE